MTSSDESRVHSQPRPDREEGGAPNAHVSVLMDEVLAALALEDGQTVVDATAGAGGHSEAILRAKNVRLIALDADPQAAAQVAQRLVPYGDRAAVVEANFSEIESALRERRIVAIDRALFDLGWNRGQLTQGKGLSIKERGDALSMSYGAMPASGFTAADILNSWDERVLADVFFGYGEERYARRIAERIVAERAKKKIETVGELVDIVTAAVPAAYRRGKIHFATKTFQALRIAVNDELGVLRKGIRGAWSILSPSGRIVVISFHSIEDRAVKQLFRELAQEGGSIVTKKPVIAGEKERSLNPSARSAKMRVIAKHD